MLTVIPSPEVACDISHLDRNELPHEMASDVNWGTQQDLLSRGTGKSEFPDTKRGILNAASSVFDPLGLAAQYVIKTNLIAQEL